jgi:hypothetical protein
LAAVWLEVRIDVIPSDPGGKVSEPEATAAAQDAVYNALKQAEDDGFDHQHAEVLSLSVDYVEAADFDATV